MQATWARYAVDKLRRLRAWRSTVEPVLRAARRMGLDADIYLVGSVAEGTYTVLSDIDLLVVVRSAVDPRGRARLARMLWEEAYREGLDLYAPVNLIVVDAAEAERFLRSSRRAIHLYP